jgi:hypothetical protein
MERIWLHGERWPECAGQEVKLMEVALEVDRTRILRVLSALPHRVQFTADGRPNPDDPWNAKTRIERAFTSTSPTAEEQIEHLQADASYFWEPTENEWAKAAYLIGVRVADLRKAKFRPRDYGAGPA